ncbi:FG-GAP repeat protein [Nonomuraea wenchangensis]|uniref:FG-GAP repeat-containing protein n=1 Tax=Nonomuraea wenchangensis TaxID=568860 RepID=A0A1I0KSS4_9ACTN|nr:FG-GAP repeat protein [Nonomuraea wenchangensis]SEU28675.1 FG-GAP repeat-containing protein [Nonomuraea wenchangensis]
MRLGGVPAALLLIVGTTVTPVTAAWALTGRAAAACATPADFDGDGVDDVAVGDPFGDDDKGAVQVVSGGKVVPVPVPGLATGDGFGWSVRLANVDGDPCADLVVGAPYADVGGEQDAGAVYVVYGGGTRAPVRLTAARPQRFAHFGWSLAARGDLLAIGAPYEDDKQFTDAGAVYVRKGEGELRRISQESVDVRGNSEVGDQFGWSMAWGPKNALLVGVPYENDDGAGRQVEAGKINSGSAVFLDDVFAAKLTSLKLDSPTARSGDRYGYAVAYSEGSGYAISSPGAGSVQLLDPAKKVIRTVKQGGKDGFGFALAASADGRLAVGAPYGGGVRVVSWRDAAEDRRLTDAEGLFGWSVAFSGNKLFVGQPDARPAGQVAVAGRNAENLETVKPPKGAQFGVSVAG